MDVIEWLNSRLRFGMKKGLSNIHSICSNLGNPNLHPKVIHVVGSNGKGTVSSLLDHYILSTGSTTLRFTSPHLVSVNERIRLSGVISSKDEFESALQKVYLGSRNLELTFFEVITATAFVMASENRPEWLILEAGIGGRLDSTNVVDAEYVVLTGITLEHTSILGNTKEEILKEKLGVLKRNKSLICADLDETLIPLVYEKVESENAKLYETIDLPIDVLDQLNEVQKEDVFFLLN
jgi:dihydrofolate synthase / folylpolyglutamate synthase